MRFRLEKYLRGIKFPKFSSEEYSSGIFAEQRGWLLFLSGLVIAPFVLCVGFLILGVIFVKIVTWNDETLADFQAKIADKKSRYAKIENGMSFEEASLILGPSFKDFQIDYIPSGVSFAPGFEIDSLTTETLTLLSYSELYDEFNMWSGDVYLYHDEVVGKKSWGH